jgi:hypothetical protein
MADDRPPERPRKARRESPDAKDMASAAATGASDELVSDSGQTSESRSRAEVKLDPAAQTPTGSSRRLALMRFRRRPQSR